MRRRRTKMNIQNKDGYDDRACDQYHGEEEVLADQRCGQRGWRIDLGNQEQKDVEGIQDCNPHCNLLPGVGWDVEDEEGDGTDGDARKDEVDGVEESLPPNRDVELDVWIRFGTTRVKLLVLLRWDGQEVPFGTFVIISEVDTWK